MSGNGEKNPYALRRNLGAIASLACLVAYFVAPAASALRMAILVVFFVLITVDTLFQQQYRNWEAARRSPDDYDEDGRLKKYSRSRK